jgi:hypothetical protein
MIDPTYHQLDRLPLTKPVVYPALALAEFSVVVNALFQEPTDLFIIS